MTTNRANSAFFRIIPRGGPCCGDVQFALCQPGGYLPSNYGLPIGDQLGWAVYELSGDSHPGDSEHGGGYFFDFSGVVEEFGDEELEYRRFCSKQEKGF